MIRAAKDYAADLKLVENAKSNLQSVKDILEAVPQIGVEFEDPTVSLEKKHLVIDRVFPKEIRNFLKVLCDNGDFGLLDEIEQAYMELTKTPEKVGGTGRTHICDTTDNGADGADPVVPCEGMQQSGYQDRR